MNAVTGTIFTATFPLFEGNFRGKCTCTGHATVKGIIISDSCYTVDNKHRVWFKVLESDNAQYPVGKETWKQGKNFYACIKDYEYPVDYELRADCKNDQKDRLGIAHR